MAKKVEGYIKLQIPAGKATPAPPVGPALGQHGVNIVDITQTVMKEYFAMIMLVELDKLDVPFREFTEEMKQSGKEFGVDISVMHEDIFNTMHRI